MCYIYIEHAAIHTIYFFCHTLLVVVLKVTMFNACMLIIICALCIQKASLGARVKSWDYIFLSTLIIHFLLCILLWKSLMIV